MRTNGLTRLALLALQEQEATTENQIALIDLVTRALDEIDRLHPIVEALAASDQQDSELDYCHICDGKMFPNEKHLPDCAWIAARILLAKETER